MSKQAHDVGVRKRKAREHKTGTESASHSASKAARNLYRERPALGFKGRGEPR